MPVRLGDLRSRQAQVRPNAVIGTQTLADVRLPDAAARWTDAALVCGYAPLWFAIEDQVKLLACRAFDRTGRHC